jgi:hypothetical protein
MDMSMRDDGTEIGKRAGMYLGTADPEKDKALWCNDFFDAKRTLASATSDPREHRITSQTNRRIVQFRPKTRMLRNLGRWLIVECTCR